LHILELMEIAIQREASDLHLVNGMPPSLRVAGEIEFLDAEPLVNEDTERLLFPLLNESQRERLARERELEFSYQEDGLGRFRASLYYSKGALEACFRVVPARLKSFEELNLPPVVRRLALLQSGLLLITGRVGQGKTTTMNAIIDLINSERRARVVTVEDPIEYVHSHKRSIIIQREVETDTLSFSRALISALRQDPNVLCVGEMRDLETISTALTAAETGHLVLSTLHTPNAAQTVSRIIDVFPPYQQTQVRMQLANSLQGVISQQLLPRVAEKGRILAAEVMVATPAVRHLIREQKLEQINNVISMGKEDGMILMDRSLRSLYEQGIISYDTALNHCIDMEAFKSFRSAGPGTAVR
jgi:twitching motility protein PilT